MKKLLTLALSAIAVLGMTSCAAGEKVFEREDGKSYHAVGGWDVWEANKKNGMSKITIEQVKKLDAELGAKLEAKNPKYLVKKDITLKDDAGWTAKALVGNEVQEFDGGHTIKVILAHYNSEDQTYANDQWIPNPADTSPAHAEALTDNIFMPNYAKEADAHGFSWADNPVITSATGKYTFILADYGVVSTQEVVGYGFAAIAKK